MKIVHRKISELRFSEYNPRRLSPKEFDQLKKSLKGFGIVEAAVINVNPKRLNIIVGGHARIKVAKELGHNSFPCVEVNLSLDKERELNIRLNRNVGEFDEAKLSEFFDPNELVNWGFDPDEVRQDDEDFEIEEEQLREYKKSHILLSFPPDRFLEIQPHIEALAKIAGMEIEQASN